MQIAKDSASTPRKINQSTDLKGLSEVLDPLIDLSNTKMPIVNSSGPKEQSDRYPTGRQLERLLDHDSKHGTFSRTSGILEEVIDVPPTGIDTGIERVIEQIKLAKESVHIAAYIFDQNSEIGLRLLKTLKEKQAIIPDFKIFIAANKVTKKDKVEFLEALKEFKIKASVSLHPKGFFRSSLHSKLYVIDSKLAYIGGDNIDNPREADLLIGLSGKVVSGLLIEYQKDFLKGQLYKTKNARTLASSTSQPEVHSSREIALSIVGKEASSSWKGNHQHNVGDRAMKGMIALAKEKIRIMTPNFNDLEVWEDLKNAAWKNVKVEILLPKNYNSLGAFVDRATNYAIVAYVHKLPEEIR